ncbi:Eco47II family restriction endonuclease [Polynucleobacter sp. MWH-S4W17]|uniref:Eco47II family restriction endonuclease n=1 Tax=Polynucleobacter sp. MWH-S4W17 TaxID=1855910 RepID=UPI001BFD4AD1|nr:Eco47II family restriction endonuclease [Polynucleobacter sp. MWH-S4W17]QWD81602.1 Eco47II family restriction endonuclease [Polynucleobacter sp. MWH-S4W17]
MPYVSFITDARFKKIISEILAIGDTAQIKANEEFERNVIDPFSMLMEMACFDMDFDNWLKSEKSRQIQKTLSNDIGMLHQKILGSVKGWKDLKVGGGIDLANPKRKIIAEIKNKHNTVTGGKRVNNYQELDKLVMPKASHYKGYTAYFVEIIPSTAQGYEKPFTPSDKERGIRCEANPKIIQIDGNRFYKLVTGVDDALEQVFKAIPKVIKDCRAAISMSGVEEADQFFKSAYVPKPPKTSRRKNPKASK